MQAGLDRGREALRRFLVGADDLTSMLSQIVLLAIETVPGGDLASITMMRDGRPMTPVFTDKAAEELDESQYELGDGPCLAAIRHHGVERVRIASETRWPTFVAAAQQKGVTAVLSAPLLYDDAAVGGLNMYSQSSDDFDEAASETALLFAD